MTVTIKRYEGMNGSPAVELAYRAFADLIRDNLALPAVSLHWSYDALVAFVDEKVGDRPVTLPVGVIVYEKRAAPQSDIWLVLGHVAVGYRGRGIYRALWDELVKVAQGVKLKQIVGATQIANEPMRRVAKKLGRREHTVTLLFDVPSEMEIIR